MYHVIYNYCEGENTISKCQRTEESTRKLRALLYYVHMNKHNWINWKLLRVLNTNFYRLVWFHIQRHFSASLSVRVSNSGHPVKHVRHYCTNKPNHKLHHCMIEVSTQHYKILHNPTILHMKTFFAPDCHLCKKTSPLTKLLHSSLLHPCALHTPLSTSKYYSNIYSIK